jgi:hypothetical protein
VGYLSKAWGDNASSHEIGVYSAYGSVQSQSHVPEASSSSRQCDDNQPLSYWDEQEPQFSPAPPRRDSRSDDRFAKKRALEATRVDFERLRAQKVVGEDPGWSDQPHSQQQQQQQQHYEQRYCAETYEEPRHSERDNSEQQLQRYSAPQITHYRKANYPPHTTQQQQQQQENVTQVQETLDAYACLLEETKRAEREVEAIDNKIKTLSTLRAKKTEIIHHHAAKMLELASKILPGS